MASIDKMYGTKQQYKQFYNWCSYNKPSLIKFFYNLKEQNVDGKTYIVSNFPSWADYYLMRKCPIPFVIERLHEQYGEKYWRFTLYRQYKDIIFGWIIRVMSDMDTKLWRIRRRVKSNWWGYFLQDISDLLHKVEMWFCTNQ
jgi:hypothetical protein